MAILSPDQIDPDDDRLLDLLNALPSMALILDEELSVVFANQSFCDFVDEPPEEITGRDFPNLLPADLKNNIESSFDELSPENNRVSRVTEGMESDAGGPRQEWTLQVESEGSSDRKLYYVFARARPDQTESAERFPDRKQRDLNNEVFEKMTNSIQEAFWLMDSEWSEVLYANNSCERIYGVSRDTLLEDVQNWTRHIVQEDLDKMYANLAPEAIENLTEPRDVSFRLDHPELGRRHINLEISPIPEDGKTQQLVGLATDVTEQERELQQNQQKLEAILNSTLSTLGLLEPDGTILEANRTALDIIDSSMEELRGQLLWESPWWSHTGSLKDRVRRAVEKAANGTIEKFKVTYPLPDGGEIDSLNAIIPVENDGGQVEFLVFEGRNISSESRLRDKLEEQRDFLDSIINAAPQGIFVKTSNGQYVLANDTISNIFGPSREEIEGKNDFELVDDETAETFTEEDERVLREQETLRFEERLLHAGRGETRTFLTVKTLLLEDRPRNEQLILGITTDITKRKSLQKELEQQKEFLQTMIDSAPNFIFVKDWNGVYRNANKTLAYFYGTTPEEMIGRTDADFNPDSGEVEWFHEADREVMWTGEVKEISEEPVTSPRTGETHWFQTTKVPLHTDRPVEDRQVLGVATDITEKRKIRENLEESLREKETLLGEIHHRVKNNLQIVQSMLRMETREADDENPALQDCINRINSMALLHEKLYQSEKLNEIDISSYFEELSRHLQGAVASATEDIEISFTVDVGSIPIQDAVSCGLVVNELVTNSLQHGFRNRDEGRVHVSLHRSKGGYEIIVEDNGQGLPEGDELANIESTGIRIIRSIVEYEYDGELIFHEDDGVRVEVSLYPET